MASRLLVLKQFDPDATRSLDDAAKFIADLIGGFDDLGYEVSEATPADVTQAFIEQCEASSRTLPEPWEPHNLHRPGPQLPEEHTIDDEELRDLQEVKLWKQWCEQCGTACWFISSALSEWGRHLGPITWQEAVAQGNADVAAILEEAGKL